MNMLPYKKTLAAPSAECLKKTKMDDNFLRDWITRKSCLSNLQPMSRQKSSSCHAVRCPAVSIAQSSAL